MLNKCLIFMFNICILFFFFPPGSSFSEISGSNPHSGQVIRLTLPDAFRLAMQQNSEVAISEAKTAEATETLRLARAPFLPQVSLGGSYTFIEPPPEIEISLDTPVGHIEQKKAIGYQNNYAFNLSVGQSIFSWGADHHLYQAARSGVDLARLNQEYTRQNVALETTRSFNGILMLQEQKKLLEHIIRQRENHLQAVSLNYKNGVASELEKLITEVSLESLRPELDAVGNQLGLARLAFQKLLGLQPDQIIELEGEITFTPLTPNLEENLDQALRRNRSLQIMEKRIEIVDRQARSADARNLPSLLVGGQAEYADPYNLKDEWGMSYAVFASASWALFDGFISAAKTGQLKARRLELTHALKDIQETVALAVQSAYLSAQNAERRARALEYSVALAEKAHQIARTGYQNGTATSNDLLDAEVGLMQVKLQHLKAMYEYTVARWELRRASGSILDCLEGR